MRRECRMAWLVGALLLVACSGGGDEGPGGEVGGRLVVPSGDPDVNWIVVRYDHDGDTHLDTVTLDAARNPLVIVEAIRGTPDGGGLDVTTAWRGEDVDGALNDALQLHLARSFSVASPTDLDLVLRDRAVTITVIE